MVGSNALKQEMNARHAVPLFRKGIHTIGAAPCSSTFLISCVLVAGLPAQWHLL